MIRQVGLALALLALAGCEKAAEATAPDPCVMPTFNPTQKAGTYAGAREAALFCVKQAAYEIARAGGPVEPITGQALAKCAAQEQAVIAALKKEGPVYDYMPPQIHEQLTSTARRSAVQARATGCGRKPGEAPDSVNSD